jgi:hypothetical protein
MPQVRALLTPKNLGQRLTAAEINDLNDYPMARGGDNPLLDHLTTDLTAYDWFFLNSTGGAGRLHLDADYLLLDGTGWPTFSSARSVTSWAPPFTTQHDPASFEATLAAALVQVSSLAVVHYFLTFPVDAVISAIRLPVYRASGGSGLPGTMPNISLDYITTLGALTNVGSATDSSANEAAYEAFHNISITGLSHTVAASRRYILTVVGDSASSSASNGLNIYPPFVDLSTTKVRF